MYLHVQDYMVSTKLTHYSVTTPPQEEDPQQRLLLEIIRDDSLRQHEREQRDAAEHCLLTAAKLMAPLIEGNFATGFDWCIDCVRASPYAELASELEIAKAASFLKEKEFQKVSCCHMWVNLLCGTLVDLWPVTSDPRQWRH